MQDHLSKTVFFPQNSTNQFWTEVQGRYGKGSGYRDDVLDMYADQLDGHEDELKAAALTQLPLLIVLAETINPRLLSGHHWLDQASLNTI